MVEISIRIWMELIHSVRTDESMSCVWSTHHVDSYYNQMNYEDVFINCCCQHNHCLMPQTEHDLRFRYEYTAIEINTSKAAQPHSLIMETISGLRYSKCVNSIMIPCFYISFFDKHVQYKRGNVLDKFRVLGNLTCPPGWKSIEDLRQGAWEKSALKFNNLINSTEKSFKYCLNIMLL